jgi:hypothetical protein
MRIEDLPEDQQAIARKIVEILQPFTPEERKRIVVELRERLAPRALLLWRAGNGDWSLHPPIGTMKGDMDVTLKSGSARMCGDTWDRPTPQDYDHAWMMYQEHLARSPAHEQGEGQQQVKVKKRSGRKSSARGKAGAKGR